MSTHPGLIVSVSGIRGIVGEGLTPAAVLSFAAALGAYTGGGRVVVARDGRRHGPVLRHAVLAGLLGAGCDVHDLGIAPTPTVGLAVRTLGADGAIQITASHNPAPWNGLKLFGSDGRVLNAVEGRKVVSHFEKGAGLHSPGQAYRGVHDCGQALEQHRDRVLQLVDVAAIRAARLKALVDANNGAGGRLAGMLLEALQVETVCEGGAQDGNFLHEPEPTEANLRTVGPLVVRNRAAIGFALDPDADRLALIDEQGRYIGEELTLALAVRFRLSQKSGPVVVNMSTSRVIEDLAREAGSPFARSAVGEANVADRMIELGAVIGGEGNGGVIDPRVGYVRDPFIGMGLILNLLAQTGKKLSQLVAEMPAYHIVKDRYTVPAEKLPQLYALLAGRWPEARPDRQDGLRLDWPDRWVHVRPSNTEPIVRVIAEAPRREDAESLCREVGQALDRDLT